MMKRFGFVLAGTATLLYLIVPAAATERVLKVIERAWDNPGKNKSWGSVQHYSVEKERDNWGHQAEQLSLALQEAGPNTFFVYTQKEMDDKLAALNSELNGKIAGVDTEIKKLRTDIMDQLKEIPKNMFSDQQKAELESRVTTAPEAGFLEREKKLRASITEEVLDTVSKMLDAKLKK
jgi:hypothetical protein